MSITLIFYTHFQGYRFHLSSYSLFFYSSLAMACQGGGYLILRLGVNKRFKDPSMTIPQIMVATFWLMLVTFYCADQVRSLMLLIYMVVFIFGVFKLQIYQFLLLSLFALGSYSLTIIMLLVFRKEGVDIRLEILHCVGLGMVLFWFSFVGGYINALREKLVEALGIIKRLATHDELTNVHNRRKLFESLQREKALADRNGSSFSICMFDLDLFKEVNDRYGHLMGDTVLKIVAQAIQNNLREEDYIARYGGEEFVLILSYPELDSGVKCAERLRRLTQNLTFPDMPKSFQITISFGVTEYKSPEPIKDTLARADAALYRAKTMGRNRVEYDSAP